MAGLFGEMPLYNIHTETQFSSKARGQFKAKAYAATSEPITPTAIPRWNPGNVLVDV